MEKANADAQKAMEKANADAQKAMQDAMNSIK